MTQKQQYGRGNGAVLSAAVDSGVFAALPTLQPWGSRAVQAVYTAILRRYPDASRGLEGLVLDSGWSVSTVSRAIRILKRTGLIESSQRGPGRTALIRLTDLRDQDTAKRCLANIRTLATRGARDTADPVTDPVPDPVTDPVPGPVTDWLRTRRVETKREARHVDRVLLRLLRILEEKR